MNISLYTSNYTSHTNRISQSNSLVLMIYIKINAFSIIDYLLLLMRVRIVNTKGFQVMRTLPLLKSFPHIF